MLLKLFRCDVSADQREVFAQGQRAWQACAQLDGFVGQMGGWHDDQAWVAAWWRDWASYQDFALENHDAIYQRSGQAGLYSHAESSFWTSLDGEKVDRRASFEADPVADSMQLEWIELAPGTQPDFRDFLAWRWRPGLAGTAGLIQARITRHRKRPGIYLAWSTWTRGAVHRSAASWLQPGFRLPQRRLRVLRSHQLTRIALAPSWQIPPLPPDSSLESAAPPSQEPS